MEEGSCRAAAAGVLPDELILEILTRLPVKSLCRCKCVSRAWRALISDPANRRRFAQTLSGLFFQRPYGSRPAWDFIGLSMSSVSPPPPPPGVDTALSFLPPTCGEMELLDSCNGLLLLCCTGVHESPSPPPFYVVCNPATGEWVTLPQPSRAPGIAGNSTSVGPPMDTSTAALGFDPSISPHFHVFQLVQVLKRYEFFFLVQEVEIYSSRTGRWVLSKINCSDGDYIRYTGNMTYFKGFLHFCIVDGVGSVDTEGQTWRISRVRQSGGKDRGSCVGHSQGRLLYVDTVVGTTAMSVYVLKDLDSEEWIWIFKQSIGKPYLFGEIWDYYTVAFHPDSDLIFFYHWCQKKLMSYDTKNKDVHVICTLEVPDFDYNGTSDVQRKFFPYVPLYSRALPSSRANKSSSSRALPTVVDLSKKRKNKSSSSTCSKKQKSTSNTSTAEASDPSVRGSRTGSNQLDPSGSSEQHTANKSASQPCKPAARKKWAISKKLTPNMGSPAMSTRSKVPSSPSSPAMGTRSKKNLICNEFVHLCGMLL